MKKKIKENAVRLFCERGFSGTSIRNISDSVGITAAAVYSHFKSKEELFLEVFAEGWRAVAEEVNIIKNKEKDLTSELLFKIYKYHVNYYLKEKEKTIFLFRSTMFPASELKEKVIKISYRELNDTHEFIGNIFKDMVAKGIVRNIPIENYVYTFYRLIDSFIFEITALNKAITDEELNKHWQCYWQYIKA